MPELSVLIAARDEEERIGQTVAALRHELPGSTVVVGDDGSRDRTAERARAAGAIVVSLPRLGKGEALNAAERAAPPGALLLADADLRGEVSALVDAGADLAVAAFAERQGGGFGIAKGVAAEIVRLRAGLRLGEPLSGQRYLSERARAAVFPLARGFGCEIRMTIDAIRAGLTIEEVRLPLRHRATGRDLAGFAHRGRQLVDALLAAGPLATNHRGNRLPIVGLCVPLAGSLGTRRSAIAVAAVAAVGLLDDLCSGPERGVRAHLRAGRTTGVAKLVAIPLVGLLATRSVGGALAVGLAANALNQLDTKPGRALKAFLLYAALDGSREVRPYRDGAVLLLPYDLRERVMLGDAGSNALGAVIGLSPVVGSTAWRRWTFVGALAAFNLLGERVSIGAAIERLPVVSAIDRVGRLPA